MNNGFCRIICIRSFECPKASHTINRPNLALLAAVLAVALAWAPARGDQRYAVSGTDQYTIGRANLSSNISYAGTQHLTVARRGKATRFSARVRYSRTSQGNTSPSTASFAQEMTPAGELKDTANLDPDYLTVLNQPFAVQLDAATLMDIRRLSGRVPFDFPSPMTGGSLRGFLQRGPSSRFGAVPVIAVTFDAVGPMRGPLPGHPNVSIRGTMRMNGTAYYSLRTALLMGLNETLTIDGNLREHARLTPVTIVYRRSIKAQEAPPLTEAAASPAR